MNRNFRLIAETAFSHEGDFDYLLTQIEKAAEGQVDYVKFQVFIEPEESYVSNKTISFAKKLVFSKSQWIKAFKYAKKLNLKTISLPLNISSVEFCLQNDGLIDMYEVHSVCFCELFLLKELKKTRKNIILGVGGRNPKEIDYVIENFRNNKIIIMMGFQSFPTDYKFIGLKKVKTLKRLYGTKIGFADHTAFDDEFYHNLNDLALSLGVEYFEKHIVVEKGIKRIDYESAISYNDFIQVRNNLEKTGIILGDGNLFHLNSKEIEYRNREKKIIYRNDLEFNNIITLDDIFYKVTPENSDFEQIEINNIIGKRVMTNVSKGQTVKLSHIKEE